MEQTQLHQIIIFDLKEISAEAGLLESSTEIVLNVCTRFGETFTEILPLFYTTASHMTCLKTPHILVPNSYSSSFYHFVHPFHQLIKLVYTRISSDTRLSLFYTNTTSRPTMQTLSFIYLFYSTFLFCYLIQFFTKSFTRDQKVFLENY